jgi:CBS domain-containing protein
MTDHRYRTHVGDRRASTHLETSLRATPVLQLVSPIAVEVHPDAEMEAVAAALLAWSVTHYPVIDGDRRPVGMLRREDVLQWQLDACSSLSESPEATVFGIRRLTPAAAAGHTVSDVMERSLVAVMAHASLDLVAAILAHERAPVAVVVDGDGRARGMVWAQQLMRWLAEHMGYAVPELDQSSGSR